MPHTLLEGMHRRLPGTLGRDDAANTILTGQDRYYTNLPAAVRIGDCRQRNRRDHSQTKERIEPAAGVRTAEAGMMGRLGNQV